MATAVEMQKKLKAKLMELFQLDQPDLDFGFYRVMHAKQDEITKFLDERLPEIMSTAFADSSGADLRRDFEDAKNALVSALGPSALEADGSVNGLFATTPMAQKYNDAKKALEAGASAANAEADVYDWLYHFFERYYDKGDFVSLRRLTRETDRKAKPYAIPYAGEEVLLHWANADQYYIKTSENYSHFTVDITQHPAFLKMTPEERLLNGIPSTPLRLHFNLVDADEGEHGNVKDKEKRFFIIHDAEPCTLKDDGLHINFEHRADPEAKGKKDWQDELRKHAAATIKAEISGKAEALMGAIAKAEYPPEYARLLFFEFESGDKKDGKKKAVLETYIWRYTASNTADYFIHKDLGGFLRRELDFYIKNDLMILDDITAATPDTVAKWLGKFKTFRKIAEEIITFLAQLEDFQKKLWLKKKFVVQCDWCMTLDIVEKYAPELIAEILANKAQLDEWKKWEIDVDPKTIDMHAIDARMVDTKFFGEEFKAKLLCSIPDLEEQSDGLLIHSENFGALRLLFERYREQIKGIYIDPPYNSKTTEILYKNNYKDSSWLSLMENRLSESRKLGEIPITVAIDENEQEVLSLLLGRLYAEYDKTNVAVIHNKKGIQGDNFSFCHEYAIFCIPPDFPELQGKPIPKDQWEYSNLRKWGRESDRSTAKNCFYPIYVKDNQIVGFGEVCEPDEHPKSANVKQADGSIAVYPIEMGTMTEKKWRYARNTIESILNLLKIVKTKSGEIQIQKAKPYETIKTVWSDSRYIAGDFGTKWLTNLGIKVSESLYPKSIHTVYDSLKPISDSSSTILDYFGGSGTTAHAVIDLNRKDAGEENHWQIGKRKYILVEMGEHFDTVLKPRIEKVIYSPDWKDGKPLSPEKGISHCFKYMRLESYEDTLNNLVVDGEKGKAFAGVGDYFLKYMLEVETKGSPSLLNVACFADPFNYRLEVKKPGSEEHESRVVDLMETFNYLIGLRVKKVYAPSAYEAEFERTPDPELPNDANIKLKVKLWPATGEEDRPLWRFRMVEGWIPKNRATPDDGAKERVLVVWRTLTGDIEKDNAVLNAYLQRKDVNALDGEYDVIYVNGSNNVPNLRKDEDTWKVRLIEEDFFARMWEGA